MSIKLYLGLPGSGKTVCAVREMSKNRTSRPVYTNIATKHIPNATEITPEMLITKTVIPSKSGRGQDKIDLKLNSQYWLDQREKHGAMDIILDEAHTLINSRRFMSKVNSCMTDFLALIRRMLGSNDSGMGQLILITQLDRRIDVIARESATSVRWHVCHFMKKCKRCGHSWKENNETPEQNHICPRCGGARVKKYNHAIEVWHFRSMQSFTAWREMRLKTYHRHYFVTDIEQYFRMYDTLQINNMLTEIYE